ncbi:SusC/RagA family TonB-linked outer membrane protein [Bacteroides caccae]|uniref:TonB-dependent receptor n=1 Tax=Bacteroides caccae TaxID=47678 RepID=A0A6A1JVI9_9BACE|nr:TonB-dependent receptor [Bacteroides caccae]KAA5479308.1 TonB-dependent receptor [Bacteroides caccae]KAA5491858.1 TonB-dependent receptor [Bacteroides caccae]KAA5492044.1 TonB-dependent receptor [Bacteroides caccae]KAA5504407.1 TonB-dependent receptor [Bacteroides caccae]
MNTRFIRISLKKRIFISYCLIGLFFFLGENCYASKRPVFRETVRKASADNSIVRGRVVDVSGEPLIGATIREKGGTRGTVTDIEGNFILSVPDSAVLQVSFVGYESIEVSVGGRKTLEIQLRENTVMLDNVIITALGLEKKEASLAYSIQKVKGEELTRMKEVNMITALAGKAAGVQINKNSSGIGGSAKVSLRGIRSASGDNQPLYVIDGVPMLNIGTEQAYSVIGGTANAGNRDGGDGISNLNPEDVESISILKGAPAAALYGSQAANGVILITTKKGNTAGQRNIYFSTGLTFDKAFSLPKMQNCYGVSDVVDSWGEKAYLPTSNELNDFFRTGLTSITSVSVNYGNEKIQTYFSYANTTGRGIVDKNQLTKHNINLRETAVMFNQRLKLDGNVNVMRQIVKNKPVSGGFYMNPLVGLYRFPRGEDLSYYKDNYEIYDPERKLGIQNWHTFTEDFEQNPYWIQNRIQSKETRMRSIISLSANLRINSWLTVQARGSVDYISDKMRQKFYASTAPALCGANGRYIEMDYQETLIYGDVMAMGKRKWEDFALDVAIGGSINDKNVNSTRYDSKNASLKYANVFNLANIVMNGSASIDQKIDSRRQLQSVFGTAQVGYQDKVFLDLTARNDWASTLAYTSHEKSGFFYPSAGLSFLIDKWIQLPEWISFAKLRGTYSKVGNDIPQFITNSVSHITAGGELQANDAAPFKEMEPEMTHSVEVGTEWRFFQSRLGFNLTYYRTNTHSQFFKLPALAGDMYAYRYVNAGDIQNRGWELTVDATPVLTPDFTWKTSLNFSSNRNEIKELHEELKELVYGPSSFSSSYAMKLVKGGSIGDIYGKAFVRDAEGNIVYQTEGDHKGLPAVEGEGNTIKVGNANPRFIMGWNHTFSYKGFSLYFLLDWRYGGKILSQTQAEMDLYGVSQVTALARDRGYVTLEGQQIDNVKGFYKNIVGGRAGVTEYYMYDATNLRLREVSLNYTFPKKWMQKTKVLKDLQLAFVARNLCFLYKKAPFDPDLVLSTGNDNQGIEVFGMPTTRSLGFTVKCEF